MAFSESDRRAGIYIALALALLVAGMVGSYLLLAFAPAGMIWGPLVLSALPGAVLTLYVPALRDLKKWVRTVGFALLALGTILGFVVLSSSLASAQAFIPTVVVGSVSLAITAVVAFIDWAPDDSERRTTPSGTRADEVTEGVPAPPEALQEHS